MQHGIQSVNPDPGYKPVRHLVGYRQLLASLDLPEQIVVL